MPTIFSYNFITLDILFYFYFCLFHSVVSESCVVCKVPRYMYGRGEQSVTLYVILDGESFFFPFIYRKMPSITQVHPDKIIERYCIPGLIENYVFITNNVNIKQTVIYSSVFIQHTIKFKN